MYRKLFPSTIQAQVHVKRVGRVTCAVHYALQHGSRPLRQRIATPVQPAGLAPTVRLERRDACRALASTELRGVLAA